ncbi:hypothetical protein BGZ99_002174, partial [Dissophora globulifera]
MSHATQAAPNISPDRTRVGGKDAEIHPNFTFAGLAERPSQGDQTPQEATSRNLDLVSSLSLTTLLTPSMILDKTPVHDQDLGPCPFTTNADQRQKAEVSQPGGNNMIGSGITVLESVLMNKNSDEKASIQLREERVLRDGHIRLTLPLDERKTASAAPVEASAAPPTAARLDMNEAPVQDEEESIESLVESMDWSKTGLGPRSDWPRELTLIFQVLLKSRSPLGLYWGDNNYLLYND